MFVKPFNALNIATTGNTAEHYIWQIVRTFQLQTYLFWGLYVLRKLCGIRTVFVFKSFCLLEATWNAVLDHLSCGDKQLTARFVDHDHACKRDKNGLGFVGLWGGKILKGIPPERWT